MAEDLTFKGPRIKLKKMATTVKLEFYEMKFEWGRAEVNSQRHLAVRTGACSDQNAFHVGISYELARAWNTDSSTGSCSRAGRRPDRCSRGRS